METVKCPHCQSTRIIQAPVDLIEQTNDSSEYTEYDIDIIKDQQSPFGVIYMCLECIEVFTL